MARKKDSQPLSEQPVFLWKIIKPGRAGLQAFFLLASQAG
ncbi:hypothetical protein O166_06705 [Pseudogulbenkiania ferrooxidans EGD-HP2]|uniref:Uncharacterized protein n=1 Tax=Pseudogulbenkiania ferrooxidans EGD-HP2 TaxID=1388764 RepID=A0ABP2XP01_9NEIS|nr:hypothetical protein O166_06705 [Pseudogulbenkiania ferrooxidans EGD-HP2]